MPVMSASPLAEKSELSPLTMAPVTYLGPPVGHGGLIALIIKYWQNLLAWVMVIGSEGGGSLNIWTTVSWERNSGCQRFMR